MPDTLPDGALPPCPQPFNLAAYVLEAGLACPDKIALTTIRAESHEDWTHARLRRTVLGVATGFLGIGLRPGDRVLLRTANPGGFAVSFLGALAVGLVPVPTSPQLTRPEIARIAAEIGPRLIVEGAGAAMPLAPPCPVITCDDLHALASLPPARFEIGDAERPAYIIYTSGASGRPRAVVHAHRAVWARRMMWQGWYGLRPDDRLFHAGALNWTYTLGTGLLDPLAIGATALLPGRDLPQSLLAQKLRQHRATIFAAAPGVYRQMLRGGLGGPLPDLRHGLSAGEAMAAATREGWREATGTAVHEAFGMTECSTFLSGSPDRPAPAGGAGFAQKGRRIAVLGANGQPVPTGAPGILAVHRSDPGLFLSYLDDVGETISAFSGDWFLTGDMVSVNEAGTFTHHGRADDMMNAGGFRVFPTEVEAAMQGCADIGDCAVVAVAPKPDVTVIALAHTGPANPSALAAHAKAHLARYKQPRLFRQVASLPRTANGKINRTALRALLEG